MGRRGLPWMMGIAVVAGADPSASSSSAAVAPTPASAPASTASTAPPQPVELGKGEFVSLDHGTRGVVRVLERADGSRIVRLEGLDTSNGPDLQPDDPRPPAWRDSRVTPAKPRAPDARAW